MPLRTVKELNQITIHDPKTRRLSNLDYEHLSGTTFSRIPPTKGLALVVHQQIKKLSPHSNNRRRHQIIPNEILLLIFTFLSPPQLFKILFVCKSWQLILSDNFLWFQLCAKRGWKGCLKNLNLVHRFSTFHPIATFAHAQPWYSIYKSLWRTRNNFLKGNCKAYDLPALRGLLMLGFDDELCVGVRAGEEGSVCETQTGKRILQLSGHEGLISAVKFDSEVIISASTDHTLKKWCRLTGECLNSMDGHEGEVNALQFTKQYIVSGAEDSTLRVWSYPTGKLLHTLHHEGAVSCLHFDEDNIASGSTDSTIKLWSRLSERAPKCLMTLAGHTANVYCVQLLQNRLISGSDDATIRIWERSTGQSMNTLRGHDGGVVCIQADREKIVSGGVDKTIRIWGWNGVCYSVLTGHNGSIWSLKFDNSKIFSSSFDESLRVWDFAEIEDVD